MKLKTTAAQLQLYNLIKSLKFWELDQISLQLNF